MTKNIANVDILTDTFNTWVLRTNEVIDTIKNEALTANGVTGSAASPRVSQLWGTFTANNLVADNITLGQNFVANTTAVLIGPNIRLIANGASGALNQVLTTNGANVYWSSLAGTGTVTNITSGNGISSFVSGQPSGSITSTGTIAVRAGTGIVVNTSGVSVNTTFLNTVVDAISLQGNTWGSPGLIGNTTPSTGRFTTLKAGTYKLDDIAFDSTFEITSTRFLTPGHIDVGGGVRLRLNSGVASIQINNVTAPVSNFSFAANGQATYSNNFIFNGTARYGAGSHPNTEIGYKTIPQLSGGALDPGADGTSVINYTQGSGAHYYKTATYGFTYNFPNNQISDCSLGTALTFVNDSNEGVLILSPGTEVTLQLAGLPESTGPRSIFPGGVATALKVQANKWIVSGTGVT